MSALAEKIKRVQKHKWCDDTMYMIELFEAKPLRTKSELVRIFGNADKATQRIYFLKNKGLVKMAKWGLWELVE